jgi:putative zinc finger/helix-turn-helix YgiT family protein
MSKKRCPICGEGALTSRVEARRYGRGVDVVLANVTVEHCSACGEELVVIPAVESLHKVIAHTLARARTRLRPGEIRFLRTYLGYSSAAFARVLGVTAETVSRWESAQQPKRMAATAERLLRLMALVNRPIQSYGLEDAGTEEPTAGGALRLKATAKGWAAVGSNAARA